MPKISTKLRGGKLEGIPDQGYYQGRGKFTGKKMPGAINVDFTPPYQTPNLSLKPNPYMDALQQPGQMSAKEIREGKPEIDLGLSLGQQEQTAGLAPSDFSNVRHPGLDVDPRDPLGTETNELMGLLRGVKTDGAVTDQDVQNLEVPAEQQESGATRGIAGLGGLLPHLVPMLADLVLSGGKYRGEAGDISGQSMLDQIKKDEAKQSKLDEHLRNLNIEKMKAEAKETKDGKLKQVNAIVDGKSVILNYNPNVPKDNFTSPDTGEVVHGVSSFEPVRGHTTTSGLKTLHRAGKTIGQTGIGGSQRKFSPEATTHLGTIKTKFEADIKQHRGLAGKVELINEHLSSGNPVSHQTAIFNLAFLANGGGRLTDQDVDRFSGIKSFKERIRQWTKTAKDGKLTPENVRVMKETAMTMHKKINEVMRKKAAQASRSGAKQFEGLLSYEDIHGVLGTYINESRTKFPTGAHIRRIRDTDGKIKVVNTKTKKILGEE